jgi:phosphosulfolactate phosphohydrolase-like enzyme
LVLEDEQFYTICDASLGAIDLYEAAEKDMMAYIEKAAQRHRLKKNKLDDVIAYCHEHDLTSIIPVLKGQHLLALGEFS